MREQLIVEVQTNAAYEQYIKAGRTLGGQPLRAKQTPYRVPEEPQEVINLADPDASRVRPNRRRLSLWLTR